jgi:hypothetical protein
MVSEKFSLNTTDWKKVGKGAAIAGAGAAATFLIQYFSSLDFGVYQLLVAAALSVATNLVVKYTAGK